MKNLILICILIAAFGTSLVTSQFCSTKKVEIICESIEIRSSWLDGNLMTFNVDNPFLSTFPETSVSSVIHSVGSEMTQSDLADIKAFRTAYATVRFIPFGIKAKIPNLIALEIYNSGLVSLNKDNLKEFGSSLEDLRLSQNQLIILDADVFEYNPNLEYIELSNNPLRHIDTRFFSNLKGLKSLVILYMYSAGCMRQGFDSRNENIASFRWDNGECSDFSAEIEARALLRGDFKCLDEKIEHNSRKLEDMEKKLDEILKLINQVKFTVS